MKRAQGEESKRVGIWIRVSTDDQVRGESPEHHERRARLYAEAKDWTVVTVYRLDATSGKTVVEHPEAKRMLADVRAGNIFGSDMGHHSGGQSIHRWCRDIRVNPLNLHLAWVARCRCHRCLEVELVRELSPILNKKAPARCSVHG